MDTPEYPGFCPQKHLGGTAGCSVWSGIWQEGTPAILKAHSPGRGWQQEKDALDQIQQLDLPPSVVTPMILDSRSSPPALILTPVTGINMAHHSFSMADWSQAQRIAARFLKRWQSQPFEDNDPLPLDQALLQRLENWISKGSDCLSKSEIAVARGRLGDGSLFRGHSRVPCHIDFQPRNWLWNGQQLGVIDFEHARPDHPAFDWVRLELGLWQKMPELRDEFIEEWGGLPDWASREVIDAVIGIHAIGSIVWGHAHNDREFVFEGRRVLDE